MAASPRRGEPGYTDWCVQQIEAGHCACADCPGLLTDPTKSLAGWGHCRSCGCAHKVEDRGTWRTAEWIPVVGQGRCKHSDVRAAEVREQRAAERRRQRPE